MVARVVVRLASGAERERWDETMRAHHYLGSVGLIGESLRYVAEVDGRWVALIGWCGAAFKCAARDVWIGWPEVIQWQRLALVANNARFLILPGVEVPNLASRILGLNVRRLAEDWERAHGHRVVLAETFVDPERFRATCYRAAGWIPLGTTRGFGRSAGKWIVHGHPKLVLVRPLMRDAVNQLRDLNQDPVTHAKVVRMKLDGRRTDQLMKVLRQLPDVRSRRGIRHRATNILAIAVCATLSGARSYQSIYEWGTRLHQSQRRRLGCRMNPRTRRLDVPSEKTIRLFLQTADVERLDRSLGEWLAGLSREPAEAIAIDGKVLRGSGREGKQVQLLSGVVHGTGVTIAQRRVLDKNNETVEAPALFEGKDIRGTVITGDALHTTREFARFLVEDKGADYVLPVKNNQPTLRNDVEQLFEGVSIPPSA